MFTRILLILSFVLLFYSCSKDEDSSIDTNFSSTDDSNPTVTYDVSISSSEGGSVNTQSGRFNAGTVLKINATPDDGYKFIGWTGSNETSMEITITVNSNISLQAIFSKIFSLQVQLRELELKLVNLYRL